MVVFEELKWMYKLLKQEGRAKRAEVTTVHGVIQTPVFMNVGTVAAIKGAVSTADLEDIGTQVELSNTYHLHVRTGDEAIKKLGGLHKFITSISTPQKLPSHYICSIITYSFQFCIRNYRKILLLDFCAFYIYNICCDKILTR